jgi:UDP-glucose 4-epimerase
VSARHPDRPAVLVTGGAGYIGSHVVLALVDAGWSVVVVDDLSTGRRDLVPTEVPFVDGDVGDEALMGRVIGDHGCAAVLHFAGSIVIPESVVDPLKYYRNNTVASRALIEASVAAEVTAFVFSSTAAVYGTPATVPVGEEAPVQPINPYGASKLMTEWILRDTSAATDLRYAALRYFNVAGADAAGRSGQCSREATHLIKIACETAVGKRPHMNLYGDDYETPDGTCVRDYIHVSDLATAHLAALEHLLAGGDDMVLNCGYGRGFSVRQVLAAVERAAGTPLDVDVAPRRPGDAPELVADPRRLRQRLAWAPTHDDLDTIVESALAWERRLHEQSAT